MRLGHSLMGTEQRQHGTEQTKGKCSDNLANDNNLTYELSLGLDMVVVMVQQALEGLRQRL